MTANVLRDYIKKRCAEIEVKIIQCKQDEDCIYQLLGQAEEIIRLHSSFGFESSSISSLKTVMLVLVRNQSVVMDILRKFP